MVVDVVVGAGVVVLAGLVCSTVVTLTFLPAALVELLQWRERRRSLTGLPSAVGRPS